MTQLVLNNSLLLIPERVNAANDAINDWGTSNVYVGIGQQITDAANDALVPVANQSTDCVNDVWRNMIALVKVESNDMALMIPRVDWTANTTYAMYDDQVDMFAYVSLTATTGTVNVANSRTVNGTNTLFLSQFSPGDYVYVPGDGQFVGPQTLQVTDVFSNTSMNTNTAFVGNIISNTAYVATNTFPLFANTFYVRNTYDQVFKCLYSPGDPSTVMPLLALGGNLPTLPYFVTSDGYYWKYLYSMSAGLKQQFFSADWMPVFVNEQVVESAVDGALGVFIIENAGTGYNQNVASNSATIITITGDGSGANATAVVNSSGSITAINLLDVGTGYTYANVIVATGTTGANANIRAIIGPPGGHGSDVYTELGATAAMLSMDLSGDLAGTLPTGSEVGTSVFEFHQVSIIKEPLLTNSGNVASNINYSTVTTVSTQALPAGSFFSIGETVYQGTSLANATFSAAVVYWDDVNNILWLNDLVGAFASQTPIVGTLQTIPVNAFVETPPVIDLFTGEMFWVNNVYPVVRGADQTEQIRLLLQF